MISLVIKNVRVFAFLVAFFLTSFVMQAEPIVLFSAALIPEHFQERKSEYIYSLEILKMLGYEPYIVEAILPDGPTFLDQYSSRVFYSNVNDARLKNKGVNEARSLLAAFAHYDFDDDAIIIKLTGRYYFESKYFFDQISTQPLCDAFVVQDNYGNTITGCCALRCRYFKAFLKQLDLVFLEKRMVNIERELTLYLERMKVQGIQVNYLSKLDVVARIYGEGGDYMHNLVRW